MLKFGAQCPGVGGKRRQEELLARWRVGARFFFFFGFFGLFFGEGIVACAIFFTSVERDSSLRI